MSSANVAEIHDSDGRANNAEKELAIESYKLTREKRRTGRLQTQITEYTARIAQYTEALTCSTQNCIQMSNQCQTLSYANYNLVRHLRKTRSMVETLEAIVVMLFTIKQDGNMRRVSSKRQVPQRPVSR